MNTENVTVAIICGGKATRLYPMTESVPKALIPIDGIPVVEHIITHCKSLGFRNFVLCEGHLAGMIQSQLGDGSRLGVSITHIVEPEPLGTAGALKFAAPHLSDPFIAIQGDLLIRADLRSMLDFHARRASDATLLVHKSSHPEDSDLVDADASWRVRRIFRPQPGDQYMNLGNAGIFVFSKELLEKIPAGKASIEKDWLAKELVSSKIFAYYTEEYVKDMGTAKRLDEVSDALRGAQTPKPAAFLDRDGVIIHEKNLITQPSQLQLIDGAADAIRKLNDARIPVIVITNQPVVARNLCTEDDVKLMHETLQHMLMQSGAHVDAFYYCPHHPEKGHAEANNPHYRRECDCRKPKPGLLLQAARERNLDLSRSVMVGDTTSDIVAGMAAGCSTILVKTGHAGNDGKHNVVPQHLCASLHDAVPLIIRQLTGDTITQSNAHIKKAFVTGGAGFIGSHIVDRLLKDGAQVTVYDNFCTGQEEFIAHHSGNPNVAVIRADVLDLERLTKEMAGHDFVFHLQANADVRGGVKNTRVDLEQNTVCTWNVLEAMRINGIKHIAFSSSGTVYGEPNVFPTPESYAPTQTSLYGASKLAGEAMIESYCEYYDMTCYIFRFVSWVGERYTHGVIFDFMKKLQANPHELEVLGNGKQKKSYLDVVDGVNGIFYAIQHAKDKKNVFNLGHDDFMNVLDLADIIVDELGMKDVAYRTTGGERGWLGDSPIVHLDTAKLKSLGWKPQVSIEQGIRNTVRYLKAHPSVLEKRKVGGI